MSQVLIQQYQQVNLPQPEHNIVNDRFHQTFSNIGQGFLHLLSALAAGFLYGVHSLLIAMGFEEPRPLADRGVEIMMDELPGVGDYSEVALRSIQADSQPVAPAALPVKDDATKIKEIRSQIMPKLKQTIRILMRLTYGKPVPENVQKLIKLHEKLEKVKDDKIFTKGLLIFVNLIFVKLSGEGGLGNIEQQLHFLNMTTKALGSFADELQSLTHFQSDIQILQISDAELAAIDDKPLHFSKEIESHVASI